MATVSAYTSKELSEQITGISREEGRKVGQVAASALALYAALPSAARRSFVEMSAQGNADHVQRALLEMARALTNARWDLLTERMAAEVDSRGDLSSGLDEEQIGELAIRMIAEVEHDEPAGAS